MRPCPATRRPTVAVFAFLLPVLAAAGSTGVRADPWTHSLGPEFAVPDTSAGEAFPELEDLEAQIDLGVRYTGFTGEDMRRTYGGIPVAALGATVRLSRVARMFTSVGYGRATGDPFYDLPSGGPDRATVTTVPFTLGLKADLAHSRRIRFYAGIAFEVAWMREEVPVLDSGGRLLTGGASGTSTGVVLGMGPEFVLGDGGRALGAEIGWGGAKGDVTATGHVHQVDLTGIRGRVYLALGL